MENEFFPYKKIRKYQDELINKIREILENEKNLIVHAPTGIGKTVSSLAPAIKYALEKDKTIVFLTPKHTQHKIVIETIREIKEKSGKEITTVDFIGKQWMCPVEGTNELSSRDFMEFCRIRKENGLCEYYENIKKEGNRDDVKSFLNYLRKIGPLPVEDIIYMSKNKEYCPYEISAELAKKAKVIIGDYYHIVNPFIREIFLRRIGKRLEDIILIIDEAQNLPSRIRSMLTSTISKRTLKNAEKEALEKGEEDLANKIKRLREKIESLGNEERIVEREEIEIVDLDKLAGELLELGEEIRKEKKRSSAGHLGEFLIEWLEEREGFVRIFRKEDDNYELSVNCLDPGKATEELFQNVSSAILMSGTLIPTRMYRDLLKLEKSKTELLELPNPFPRENRTILIVPETSTKYTKRNEEEFRKIGKMCAEMANEIPGNSVIFFPSYFMRDQIKPYFEMFCKKKTFSERQGAKKEERERLLEEFKRSYKEGAVLLVVSGGSFSEGINLPGEFLKGVIIVGIPLEKPTLEMKALIDYYERIYGRGWDYGYIFPAMNKVIQAAGRLIRSEKDKGVIVLLDERFLWKNYIRMLPEDWDTKITTNPVTWIKHFFKSGQTTLPF